MDSNDSSPVYLTAPVRLARPLIDAFCRSEFCPTEHRWHARSTLPVLAIFVAMTTEPTTAGLGWAELEPDELLRASLDADPDERGFLRDLLDVSGSFYAFLADEGHVPRTSGAAIRARLAKLAIGLRPR
jgi:hypothetical protein